MADCGGLDALKSVLTQLQDGKKDFTGPVDAPHVAPLRAAASGALLNLSNDNKDMQERCLAAGLPQLIAWVYATSNAASVYLTRVVLCHASCMG